MTVPIAALTAARAKLMADPGLDAFFTGRYGRDARHWVGYKRPASAADFPSICYVPIQAVPPDQIGGMSRERVSIVVALHEPGISADVFDGVVQTAEAARLVVACLENGALGNNAIYLGETRITTDLGSRHPFYEIEITCLLGAR